MEQSWILFLLGGGAIGSTVPAIINKIKGKGEKEKDSADVLQTITGAFEITLKAIQESSAKAIIAADENFQMSCEREKRLLDIIRCDGEYKTRVEKKIATLEALFAHRGDVINKATECKFLKDRPNIECPVIKENIKGSPKQQECEECSKQINTE